MKTRIDAAPANSYDAVSIVFHWLTAFLVIAIFALVLAPGVVPGSIALHNTLGLLLLVVVPLRVVWRFVKGGALRRPNESDAMRIAAAGVHALLYVLLIAVPLLGLLYVDAKGIDFRPFGIPLPQLVDWDRDFAQSIYWWKKWTSYGILALILVHAVAAIAYHHLFRKDGVLRSMLTVPASSADGLAAEDASMTPLQPQMASEPPAFPRRSFLLSNP